MVLMGKAHVSEAKLKFDHPEKQEFQSPNSRGKCLRPLEAAKAKAMINQAMDSTGVAVDMMDNLSG